MAIGSVQRKWRASMKLVYAAAALSILALSPMALAQTTQTQPGTNQPSATEPKTTQPGTTTAPKATQPGATQPQWYSHQPGEIRASKLIGTSVKNNAGETIGDVNEVVLSKDGKVAAVVVGVGGFLGLGEREVAIAFDSLQLTQDGNQTVATVNATKETLKSAPEWKWTDAGPSGTTGTGTSPTKPSK
jgi:sporulation protein YlmC with PRC-barrel domain